MEADRLVWLPTGLVETVEANSPKFQRLASLYKALKKLYNNIKPVQAVNLPEQFKQIAAELELLADKEFPDLTLEEAGREIKRLTDNIKVNILKKKIKKLTLDLKSAEAQKRDELVLKLARQIQDLTRGY